MSGSGTGAEGGGLFASERDFSEIVDSSGDENEFDNAALSGTNTYGTSADFISYSRNNSFSFSNSIEKINSPLATSARASEISTANSTPVGGVLPAGLLNHPSAATRSSNLSSSHDVGLATASSATTTFSSFERVKSAARHWTQWLRRSEPRTPICSSDGQLPVDPLHGKHFPSSAHEHEYLQKLKVSEEIERKKREAAQRSNLRIKFSEKPAPLPNDLHDPFALQFGNVKTNGLAPMLNNKTTTTRGGSTLQHLQSSTQNPEEQRTPLHLAGVGLRFLPSDWMGKEEEHDSPERNELLSAGSSSTMNNYGNSHDGSSSVMHNSYDSLQQLPFYNQEEQQVEHYGWTVEEEDADHSIDSVVIDMHLAEGIHRNDEQHYENLYSDYLGLDPTTDDGSFSLTSSRSSTRSSSTTNASLILKKMLPAGFGTREGVRDLERLLRPKPPGRQQQITDFYPNYGMNKNQNEHHPNYVTDGRTPAAPTKINKHLSSEGVPFHSGGYNFPEGGTTSTQRERPPKYDSYGRPLSTSAYNGTTTKHPHHSKIRHLNAKLDQFLYTVLSFVPGFQYLAADFFGSSRTSSGSATPQYEHNFHQQENNMNQQRQQQMQSHMVYQNNNNYRHSKVVTENQKQKHRRETALILIVICIGVGFSGGIVIAHLTHLLQEQLHIDHPLHFFLGTKIVHDPKTNMRKKILHILQ
ncbi:unnamed protein product [Amoebophrya sp. A120]|nr:unnamed protein product [Amoebophrya sp. A120]|eukprot:GSA120T00014485001.1